MKLEGRERLTRFRRNVGGEILQSKTIFLSVNVASKKLRF